MNAAVLIGTGLGTVLLVIAAFITAGFEHRRQT
jgi:hypothetical protein